jgi:hypothetical protein
MSAAISAAAVYEREWCARSFREDLDAHLQHGFVWSSPDEFWMCRGVNKNADASLIVNPWHAFPRESQNAWLIYLLAGRNQSEMLYRAARMMPYRLEWIGWEKRNILRFYRCKKLYRF